MSRPLFPKGETQPFFEEGGIEPLLSMIMTLGAEISALSDRLETVVDLLEGRDVVTASEIEGFHPTPVQQQRRDAARKILVETLLAPLQQQAEALAEQARRVTPVK